MAQTGKKSSGKKTAKKSAPAKSGSKKSSTASRPVRREVGAVVCLFLAIFSFIGYFNVDAWFIRVFCGFVKSLIGWGYYLFPPALLLCAAILGFHRGRPVTLRVVSALLLPLLLGALCHLFSGGLAEKGLGFAEYLRRMADKTQFLVITHRRGTMEEADLLYGVTMQEKGVSTVIELDLEAAQKTMEEQA